MGIIQLTHWPLDYVMDGISIGALRTLFDGDGKKATGILASPKLDEEELSKLGFKIKKG
jgi:hypothetical protein